MSRPADAFERVKRYLTELELPIREEDAIEELVVVDDRSNGIVGLVIDCEAPILVLEQLIAPVPASPGPLYLRLLQMNRTLVHGAFVVDAEAGRVLFRDTLLLDTLDLAELESSIRALALAIAEHGAELLHLTRPSTPSEVL
ncbi:MAG: YbjN domain-containing protein [Acidobacteriota bacterium]